MSDDDEHGRAEFFSEAQEIVETLGRDVIELDDAQRSGGQIHETVNKLFRGVHTLKGLASLFGATQLASLSHELETLLDDLRLGRAPLDESTLKLVFRAVELYGRILQSEREGKREGVPGLAETIDALGRRSVGGGLAPMPYDIDSSILAVLTEYEEHRLRTNIAQGFSLFTLRLQLDLSSIDQSLDDLRARAKPFGEIITYLPTGSGSSPDSIELDVLLATHATAGDVEVALSALGAHVEEVPRVKVAPARDAAPAPHEAALAEPEDYGSDTPLVVASEPRSPRDAAKPQELSLRSVAQTVRVDIQKLDLLMNTVGELAIVRSSLGRLLEAMREGRSLRDTAADLERLQRAFDRHLSSMQDGILEVRMVPLGQVFDKLSRVVRQISREAQKNVHLVVTGAETEVDKLIGEELSDPLMHMMRNAIDHGIETEAERREANKPSAGTIALSAYQKGNHVVIEVEDDGRGIDADRLRSIAIERGLLAAEEARSTSRRDILNLVFLPGVTTRRGVSALSGRGVGMDVVKTNIARLGGVIDLQSEVGIGTKVTITLPITLAIMSALVVTVGTELFAVPLAYVQEAFPLELEAVRRVDGRDVVTFRGSSLQLVDLEGVFGKPDATDWPTEAAHAWSRPPKAEAGRSIKRYVLVAAAGSKRVGLVVHTLIGQEDVVLKTLGLSVRRIRGFAGATELGDQRLALVLDVPGLLDETSTMTASPALAQASMATLPPKARSASERSLPPPGSSDG